jgi:hypothetical protein
MFDMIHRAAAMIRETARAPAWRESAHVCALADAERHLGHAIRAGNLWIAYDAMHPHPTRDGFRVLGAFPTITDAKQAIEENVGIGDWAAAGLSVETRGTH